MHNDWQIPMPMTPCYTYMYMWAVCVSVTPLKFALRASWLSVPRMVLQVCVTSPLEQAWSLSVFERDARSDWREFWSLPVPSCRVSNDVVTLSNDSLASRMAVHTQSTFIITRSHEEKEIHEPLGGITLLQIHNWSQNNQNTFMYMPFSHINLCLYSDFSAAI